MEELRQVLITHANRYPLMQPTDAVKLIYQNEFGGGHLIRDEQACMDYLRREYDKIPKDPSLPLYEKIGNGMARIQLAAVKPEALEQLGRDFIRSAAVHAGSMERFKDKLEVLRQVTAEEIFSFDGATLESYLAEYQKAGYPMVSHSDVYREHYAPAYRVVLMHCCTLQAGMH